MTQALEKNMQTKTYSCHQSIKLKVGRKVATLYITVKYLKYLFELLLKVHETKEVIFRFALGDTLVCTNLKLLDEFQ